MPMLKSCPHFLWGRRLGGVEFGEAVRQGRGTSLHAFPIRPLKEGRHRLCGAHNQNADRLHRDSKHAELMVKLCASAQCNGTPSWFWWIHTSDNMLRSLCKHREQIDSGQGEWQPRRPTSLFLMFLRLCLQFNLVGCVAREARVFFFFYSSDTVFQMEICCCAQSSNCSLPKREHVRKKNSLTRREQKAAWCEQIDLRVQPEDDGEDSHGFDVRQMLFFCRRIETVGSKICHKIDHQEKGEEGKEHCFLRVNIIFFWTRQFWIACNSWTLCHQCKARCNLFRTLHGLNREVEERVREVIDHNSTLHRTVYVGMEERWQEKQNDRQISCIKWRPKSTWPMWWRERLGIRIVSWSIRGRAKIQGRTCEHNREHRTICCEIHGGSSFLCEVWTESRPFASSRSVRAHLVRHRTCSTISVTSSIFLVTRVVVGIWTLSSCIALSLLLVSPHGLLSSSVRLNDGAAQWFAVMDGAHLPPRMHLLSSTQSTLRFWIWHKMTTRISMKTFCDGWRRSRHSDAQAGNPAARWRQVFFFFEVESPCSFFSADLHCTLRAHSAVTLTVLLNKLLAREWPIPCATRIAGWLIRRMHNNYSKRFTLKSCPLVFTREIIIWIVV